MGNFGSSYRRRWRGVPLGGRLQRGCLFAFAGCDGEAKTSLIAQYCRPELVYRGGKPTARQISEHARALKSIGAKRVRREGSQWIWRVLSLELGRPPYPFQNRRNFAQPHPGRRC